jgi:PAS domain S-box-containing protein
MSHKLRILHLEDDPDFSELVRSLLRQDGLDVELVIVGTRVEFEKAVVAGRFDLILADYMLPEYDGLKALEFTVAHRPRTPFLIISGTIGEHAAIESLKAGATDYVLKQVPERLVPAVRRVIRELDEIRERRKIETELVRKEREGERQYRLIFDGNPTPMWIFDQETLRFLEVNDAAIAAYGYAKEEFLELTMPELRLASDIPEMIEYVHRLVDGGNGSKIGFAGVWKHRRKDGSLIDVEIKWTPISFKGRRAFLTMANDVTERKRLEHRDAALSKLGQSLSSATSAIAAAEIIKAIADDLFTWDVFTLDLYSAETDQIIPVLNVDTNRQGTRFQIETTRERKPPSRMARRVINGGAELILREEPLALSSDTNPIGDTSRPSASLMLAPVRDRTKVIGILSIQSYTLKAYTQQDLNTWQVLGDHCGGALERIRAEQALYESEMLFHSIWENSVDGMRLTDEHGRIVAVNEAFCRLVGMQRPELEGQLFTIIYAPSAAPDRILAKYRQRFKERVIEKHIERRLTLKSGAEVVLEDTNSFVELKGKPPLLLGLFRDVTTQKRLEDQLRQSQKMEAIGQLAGGVAHDFNNILTVIHGHASLLIGGANGEPRATRSSQQILQAAERAAGLTRQLLAFSRRQMIQPKCIDVNDLVCNMSKMLSRLLGEEVSLQLKYSPVSALVMADSSMLEQVLLNLAVNARDAMPGGGKLLIDIASVDLEQPAKSGESEARAGKFVRITATDTGLGIARENLRRIFEPFFTTKEIGKGTGLGLATVYGIVKQHHGWIDVESEVGNGATFRVYFPRGEQGERIGEAKPGSREARGGTETILVVEDEAPVRELVCSILQHQGYNIIQAESGVKALELWRDKKDNIDLVLTDLVMPDRVGGRELAEKLWEERPELKVIFTSGYSADAVGKEFFITRGMNYLQKPYHPQKLSALVRDCLDAVN